MLGGYSLTFLRKLGYDFPISGVPSISADIHKYGYAAKMGFDYFICYKDPRKYQLYVLPEWFGGAYALLVILGKIRWCIWVVLCLQEGGKISRMPNALHLMVTLTHEKIVDDFLFDLKECVQGDFKKNRNRPLGMWQSMV